ncbi:MAG: ThiF family adenylyltransferase, partial [Candidatus Helarchaeota archaeon]
MTDIILQNPDTGETERISDAHKTINEIGTFIMKKYGYKKPPIFYTIFKEDPLNDVYLEENDLLEEIITKKLDEKTPIWWRSSDISGELVYKLRTDRIARAGYDLQKIKETRIFIAGIGLLGSEIAFDCAVLGIKNISVLDYGVIDWFNIYRQSLYERKDVFLPKVEAAKKRLEEMGNVTIFPLRIEIPSFLHLDNDIENFQQKMKLIEDEIRKCDIIITALDTFSARIMIQTLALANDKILINTAAGMIGGIIQIVRKSDPCLGCGAFIERSQDIGACTLASFGTQKIISGFCMDIITDLIQDKKLTFNYLKYDPYRKQVETSYFDRGQGCIFCNEKDGLAKEYKQKNIKKLFNWLIG